ncbi:MAG TPA: CHRD domain-containing protein [Blastocatellia bacterium]|nr:CHRD domain-containing protein [Blastocatellia bacterium]
MKRSIATLILMALTVTAVASLMTRRAKADIVVFSAQLLSSNEVPPVTGADAAASGSAIVTLDTTASTARFDVSVNALGATTIILAHIHEAAAGVNGPVRVDSGLSPASPLTVVGGSVQFTRTNLAVPTDVRDRILANPAGFYFNVHSNLNPGGVVRGQLVRQVTSPGTGVSPTLSQWGAIIMTLLFLAAGTFFLMGRFRTAQNAGTADAPMTAVPFSFAQLARTALYVEVAVALALVALKAGPVDAIGALISGAIAAFVLAMLFSARKR